MAHATAVKRWKAAVTRACKLAGVKAEIIDGAGEFDYGISWRHETKTRPDADNVVAMLKSTIDGIFAHFGVDDSVADINFVWRCKSSDNYVRITFGLTVVPRYDLRPFMPAEKKRVVKKRLTTERHNNQSVVRKSRTGGRKESK